MSYLPQQPNGGPPQHALPTPPPVSPLPPRANPGWPSRLLLWASIVVTTSPTFIFPLVVHGYAGMDGTRIYGAMSWMLSVLGMLIAVAAFLLVVSTTWTRRLLGAGVTVACWLVSLAAPWVLMAMGLGLLAMRMTHGVLMYQVITHVLGGVGIAGLLVAWCLVRHRRWFVLIIAGGLAMVGTIIMAVAQVALSRGGEPSAISYLLFGLVELAIVFGSLGVLHLIGRIRQRTTAGPEAPRIGPDPVRRTNESCPGR